MKKTQILPKGFFKENLIKSHSAAMLLLSNCDMFQMNPTVLDELLQEIDIMSKEEALQERQKIEEADSAEQLVQIMRKGYHKVNEYVLCQKALTMQEQLLPLLLQKYKTTGIDQFIELVTMVFCFCEESYAKQLWAEYCKIRSPYARACACLMLGYRGFQDALPLLYQEFVYFKANYPQDSLEQHPLVAIYILCGK